MQDSRFERNMTNVNSIRIVLAACIALCILVLLIFYHSGYPHKAFRIERLRQPTEANLMEEHEHYQNKVKLKEEEQCENFPTDEITCAKVHSTPASSNKVYPIQLVSGSPGSGNDWILWLGAVLGYEKNMEWLLNHCEVYHNDTWLLAEIGVETHCVFIKTHEPLFYAKSDMPWATRAAVVLRHPIDAAYAEFKRQLVTGPHIHDEHILKNNISGITLSKFFNDNNMTTVTEKWVEHIHRFFSHWLSHARYWLEEWNKPLRVIIYNEFKNNTIDELTLLLQYFGYSFTNDNIHRYCCIRERPFNPNLKRGSSEIDLYKEKLFKLTPNLLENADSAVELVQNILDSQWPGVHHIKRG